ncbi:MAG: tetratricopeptide repeat protein [Chloroflexota bacterium]|nr:tetratricopeptide repeat protein [Chloroflexota bacterium]
MPDFKFNQAVTVNYALCLIELGHAAEAVSVLQCLSGACVKPAEYYVNLSLAHLHLKEYEEAERICRKGLALRPNDKDLLGNLLSAQSWQNKWPEAWATAQARLQLGRDVHCLEEVGSLFCQLGGQLADTDWPEAARHYKKAVELLSEAKQLNPRYTTGRFNLARAYFELGGYSTALDELHSLAKESLHSSLVEPVSVLIAKSLDRVAAHKECVDFCSQWLQRFPDSTELQRVRAETIVDGFCIGREKDGERIVERSSLEFFAAVVKDPARRQASDFCYLAELREWMGDTEEAMRVLDQAEALYPGHWEIPFDRAGFNWRKGDFVAARTDALTAAKLAPWRAQPWRLLGMACSSLGLEQEAADAQRRAEAVERARTDSVKGR